MKRSMFDRRRPHFLRRHWREIQTKIELSDQPFQNYLNFPP